VKTLQCPSKESTRPSANSSSVVLSEALYHQKSSLTAQAVPDSTVPRGERQRTKGLAEAGQLLSPEQLHPITARLWGATPCPAPPQNTPIPTSRRDSATACSPAPGRNGEHNSLARSQLHGGRQSRSARRRSSAHTVPRKARSCAGAHLPDCPRPCLEPAASWLKAPPKEAQRPRVLCSGQNETQEPARTIQRLLLFAPHVDHSWEKKKRNCSIFYLLWTWGKAEGAGLVQPGEEKAARGP